MNAYNNIERLRMIQVLKRSDEILEIISMQRNMALRDIAECIDIKKTTLSNILRSLVDLGFLNKDDNGKYSLGDRVFNLAMPAIRKITVLPIANEQVRVLAEKTKEAVVLSILEYNGIMVVAKAGSQQSVAVNTEVFGNLNPHRSVSGKILIAYLSDKERKRFLKEHLYLWPEDITEEEIEAEFIRIREEHFVRKISSDGQVAALAVPVFGPDGQVWAALALNLPKARFRNKHREMVTFELKEAGQRMSNILCGLASKMV
jgi:DNA-binding IclR family transcriptional regulator